MLDLNVNVQIRKWVVVFVQNAERRKIVVGLIANALANVFAQRRKKNDGLSM